MYTSSRTELVLTTSLTTKKYAGRKAFPLTYIIDAFYYLAEEQIPHFPDSRDRLFGMTAIPGELNSL